jgi:hypothetical protein
VTTARPTPATISSSRRPRARVLAGRLVLAGLLLAGLVVSIPSGFGVLWFVPYAGVGTLLVIRRPRTSIGWILIGIGWCLAIATTSINATAAQFDSGSLDPVTAARGVVNSVAGAAGFFLFAVLAIVFPSGRLPVGRWGALASLVVGIGAVMLAASLVMPIISVNIAGAATSVPVRNPAAVLPALPIWQILTPDTAILPIIALLISAAVSLLVRFRRAAGIERQQLRWITAALAFVVVAVIGGFAVAGLVPGAAESGLAWLGAIVAFPSVAIAIGVAVLRYRLYEIDRIVSRTIGWALVTTVLAAVFVAAVVALQAVLAGFTQGQTLAVAASTLVAFAIFQPLRRRVQAVVDRRFNRARYDAERTVQAFAERLRDETIVEKVAGDLSRTASATVAPSSLAIWLRPRSLGR